MLLLRFRNLPHPAIRNHRRTLNEAGYAWWGWWKKFHENPQIDLWKTFAAMAARSGGVVGLFDSGSPAGDVCRARVSRVLISRMNEFDDCETFFPDTQEWPFIPDYYRPDGPDDESISCAWVALNSIEERPCSFFGHYELVSTDATFSGMVLNDPQQLKDQDQSLWHVRRTRR